MRVTHNLKSVDGDNGRIIDIHLGKA